MRLSRYEWLAIAVLLVLPACRQKQKSAELLAAEQYQRESCACETSACVREADRKFHATTKGNVPESESGAFGVTMSRAMGCGVQFIKGDCAGPGPGGCEPGYSCLPTVGVSPPQGWVCWRD